MTEIHDYKLKQLIEQAKELADQIKKTSNFDERKRLMAEFSQIEDKVRERQNELLEESIDYLKKAA